MSESIFNTAPGTGVPNAANRSTRAGSTLPGVREDERHVGVARHCAREEEVDGGAGALEKELEHRTRVLGERDGGGGGGGRTTTPVRDTRARPGG